MPEYECAVAKSHKRLYGLLQTSQPVCCGKPMVLVQGAPQPAASAQSATAAGNPQEPRTPEASVITQKEKNWWQLWKQPNPS